MTNSVVKDLDIFTFENSNVRAMVIDGDPWFVGKDVANILGYKKTRNAIASHVPDRFKKVAPIQGGLTGKQNTVIINEAGMYKLVFSSRAKNAEKFTDWVAEDVLPAIA